MLRASGEALESEVDIHIIAHGADVEFGEDLVTFATHVVERDSGLAESRNILQELVGDAGLVEAAATVAAFQGLNRIADATGIQLDDGLNSESDDFRSPLGLDKFSGADNTERTESRARSDSVIGIFR